MERDEMKMGRAGKVYLWVFLTISQLCAVLIRWHPVADHALCARALLLGVKPCQTCQSFGIPVGKTCCIDVGGVVDLLRWRPGTGSNDPGAATRKSPRYLSVLSLLRVVKNG